MPCYQLIATFCAWPRNRRNQHAVFSDALCRVKHAFVIYHLEWMIPKRMQLLQWNLHDLFAFGILAGFFRCEQFIKWGQLNFA